VGDVQIQKDKRHCESVYADKNLAIGRVIDLQRDRDGHEG
jgi:hypothetical protein